MMEAINLLDGKVQFTFVAGNHDPGDLGKAFTRDSGLLDQYLSYEKFSNLKCSGGAFEQGMMNNTWHTFKAHGFNWLIMSLEPGQRNRVLTRASEIIRQVSKGVNGNKVYEMLANYQTGVKGGNGFLRIMPIDPGEQKISVKTYSPCIDQYITCPDH